MITRSVPHRPNDDGSILPLVLVFSTVLALVVVALATYASSTLRLGQVAERSSDRLASANGAMDSALEDLERGVGPCLLFGQDYIMTDVVNDMSPEVKCDWLGGRFKVGDLFAVVMTGEGPGRTGPLLEITGGGNSSNAEKVFEGPVYMAGVPSAATMDFQATLEIRDAGLLYSSDDCSTASPVLPEQLTISTVGYGTDCYDKPWDHEEMFGLFRPVEPDVSGFPTPAAVADDGDCRIWSPGKYTSAPVLGANNYFKSGDYYFENIGEWEIKNAFALFGYPGEKGPSIDGDSNKFADHPCRFAWTDDPGADKLGAALYFGGTTRVVLGANSSFEVSGRVHDGQNIAVQALETRGVPSTISDEGRIIRTGEGEHKQLAIQGLLWAPYAGLEFGQIANEATAALTGGAVVNELSAGASANASNFLIRVATTPGEKVLNLTTTAHSPNNQGSTSVRSVVNVLVHKGASSYALDSRRVLGLTPEGPSSPSPDPDPDPDPGPGPAPAPTTGPCNENASSWTDDFGAIDWTATYWNLESFGGDTPPGDPFAGSPVVTTTLSKIDGYFGLNSPEPGVVNPDYYAARFTTTINVATACSVTLRAGSDDGTRVRIDGTTVINNWSRHSHSTTTANSPTLSVGTHTIEIDYYERAGDSSYEFEWRS